MSKICKVDGCEATTVANNLCRKHYSRMWKNGSLSVKKHNDGFAGAHQIEYRAWQEMLRRCRNHTRPEYKNYGGRGIKVCDRWLGPDGFHNFYADMGDRPANHSLDRIDNNGDYCSENCRWATKNIQSNNRRNNIVVDINGVKNTLGQWANISGIGYWCLISRYKRGWRGKKLLLPPRNKV